MQKTLLINTGGTITMIPNDESNDNSPLKPARSFSEVIQRYPFLDDLNVDYIQIKEVIDSTNMTPDVWVEIATIIEENYDNYLGFVILHGTDTMAYTASALSYMLQNLDKPVILTGAQVPIQKTRSDGVQNLLTSVAIVEESYHRTKTHSELPEVCIFFRDHLLRGNRARKMNATDYFGFNSPNYPHLATVGTKIKFHLPYIAQSNGKSIQCYVEKNFSRKVIMLDLVPGFDPDLVYAIANSGIEGIVLKTFGTGNAPTTPAFLDSLKYLEKKNIAIVNVTQCVTGSVEPDVYETNHLLTQHKVINGYDLTPEAAVVKLMFVLGKTKDYNVVKAVFSQNLSGEMTI